ncbi:MAG TPA: DHA2 family efflux MFS transporter permease subunit [Steroidobacteraceae bacterium]|jgi:DHA2 family multidrug resistance protein|nr:DHA2 family efflux MFS transporter permease subunit [Steroidobacteraceae bacterium]
MGSWLIAPVVALAAFMEIMDISIANVSLPHIAGALSSSQDESTWVLTSYLVTNAAVMPISGWLSARFGRKRFFLVAITGFTAASLLCGLAPSLGALVVLRAAQGAFGGGLQPVGQAILADSFPPEKRGMATAIYGIAAVVAPTIGPTLGGWITDSYDWRWIFFINVPIGFAVFGLVSALIHEAAPTKKRSGQSAMDWTGFGFVALSLGCLQVVLDRGQEDDWFSSHFITVLALVSAVAFVLLVWRELKAHDPLVDVRLLLDKNFAVSFGLMLMLGFMLLGSTYLIPAFTQSLMGYRAMDAGLVLTPGGVVMIALLPFVGRSINKVDLRVLIAIGLVVGGLSLLWMTNFYLGISFDWMMLARMVQAASLAFLFIPINTLAFRDVPRDKINNASALINLARNFGGSIGISVASTILTRREQFHQSRIAELMQGMNPAYTDYAHHLAATLGSTPDSQVTLAAIYQTVVQQATLLSYLDDFKLLGLFFLALLPLLLWVRPGKGGGPAAAMH